MNLIKPEDVIRRIEFYYEGGALEYNTNANGHVACRHVPGAAEAEQ
jgi:hypothetical protein